MTDQLDLLDYPNWPGFRARDTSKAAADAVAPKAANLRERALFEIRLRREDGLHDALLFDLALLQHTGHDFFRADEVRKSIPDLVHGNACSFARLLSKGR